jgi:hypothetical protein
VQVPRDLLRRARVAPAPPRDLAPQALGDARGEAEHRRHRAVRQRLHRQDQRARVRAQQHPLGQLGVVRPRGLIVARGRHHHHRQVAVAVEEQVEPREQGSVAGPVDVLQPQQQRAPATEDAEQLQRGHRLLPRGPVGALAGGEHRQQAGDEVRLRGVARLAQHAPHPLLPQLGGELGDAEHPVQQPAQRPRPRAVAPEADVVRSRDAELLGHGRDLPGEARLAPALRALDEQEHRPAVRRDPPQVLPRRPPVLVPAFQRRVAHRQQRVGHRGHRGRPPPLGRVLEPAPPGLGIRPVDGPR